MYLYIFFNVYFRSSSLSLSFSLLCHAFRRRYNFVINYFTHGVTWYRQEEPLAKEEVSWASKKRPKDQTRKREKKTPSGNISCNSNCHQATERGSAFELLVFERFEQHSTSMESWGVCTFALRLMNPLAWSPSHSLTRPFVHLFARSSFALLLVSGLRNCWPAVVDDYLHVRSSSVDEDARLDGDVEVDDDST